MKKNILLLTLLSFLFSIASDANNPALTKPPGKPPVNKWVVKNPFEQKVFIENKGQFEIEGQSVKASDIVFGARQDGMNYYFTKEGIWIKHIAKVKRSEQEIEEELRKFNIKEEKEEGEEEKEFAYKFVDEFYKMEFANAGLQTEIISEDIVSQQYNFGSYKNNNISAHAYKKIIYKNLYPGIDMEVFFPEDKQGFKYNFILQPGADPNQIQIKYPFNTGLTLGDNGNIIIKSPFGDFTDHAPVASENNTSNPVGCSFTLKEGIVKLNVQNYNKSKGLIIDPWITTPVFSGGGDAYDIDWDNYGNCYVYGGIGPFQVLKFDIAGNILWSFTTNSFTSGYSYYGDFSVDRISGACYIVEGFNPSGAQVIKANCNGVQTAMYYGNANFIEMWRIAFSKCSNQAVIAGGGISSPSYTGCFLDTNLTNMNLVNVLSTNNAYHDMWGVTLDDFGNCYMGTARPAFYPDGFFDNVALKLPLPNLSPTTWMANTNYNFTEVSSVTYAAGTPNGFNGMTMSNLNLFTYDSYVLEEWNSGTGTITGSTNVNGGSQSTMTYGGIASDDCDHIFLGLNNSVVQYNGLVPAGVIATLSGNVYDVALNKSNVLFACGAGFVGATQLNLAQCSGLTTTNQVTNAGCSLANGSASVTVSGGTAPYVISWNTSPIQTGPVATNLAPGTYIATITDNSCVQHTQYETVIVTSPAIPVISVNSPSICNGTTATLTATGATSFTWTSGATSTGVNTASASPSSTATYTVTGTSSGCSGTAVATVFVNNNPTPSITASGATSICAGGNVTLNAGAGYSSYSWSNGATTQTINVTSSGNYSVTVTDGNGCIGNSATSTTVTVNPNPTPTITASGATSICTGGNVTLDAGAGYTSYNWSNGATTQTINVTTPGIFSVTVTDANGCTGTSAVPITITISPNLSPAITASGATNLCSGGNVTLDAGSGYNTYSWSNGATTQTINVTSSGSYSVTVTDGAGCSGSSSTPTTINVNPNPNPTITASGATSICTGGNVTLDAGAGYTTYNWSNGASSQTINVTTPGTFSVSVTDANGCTGTSAVPITITISPNLSPTITVSGATNLCSGGNVTLDAGSGYSTYSWSNGATSQTINVTNSGSYSVAVTDANGCSGSSATSTIITVNPSPTPTITYGPTTFCSGGNLTLNAGAGYSSYLWNNGATTQTTSIATSGSYIDTVSVTDANGCTGSAFANVSVTVNPNPSPIITASGVTTLCAGGSVTLDAGAGYSSYSWSNGTTTQTNTVTSSGTYSVTVTDANGCTGSSNTSTIVIVNPNPTPNITSSGTTTFCSGSNTTLNAGTGYNSYSWSNGQTIQTINVTASGSYSVTVTDANGCTGSSNIAIIVNPLPIADTSAVILSDANCGNNVGSVTGITITSGQSPYTYVWHDASGSVVGNGNPSLTNMGSGVYSVTITDANGCSTIAGPFPIDSTGGVTAAFTSNPITGETPLTVNFTNGSIGATNYLWQFGTGDTSVATNPTYIYVPLGNFSACLIAYNGAGCYDTACSTIDVFINSVFIIPNVFTPNHDNVNDVFSIVGRGLKNLEVEIYDRWGLKMYAWNTTNGGWDGFTASGVPASDGTYYYIIKAEGIDGKKYFQKGPFTLIH